MEDAAAAIERSGAHRDRDHVARLDAEGHPDGGEPGGDGHRRGDQHAELDPQGREPVERLELAQPGHPVGDGVLVAQLPQPPQAPDLPQGPHGAFASSPVSSE
jgi:hypothetical protein